MVDVVTPARSARWFATAGALAVLAATVVIGLLELDAARGGMSLVRRTISHHALTGNGWAFDLAVLLIAAGSLGITVALTAAGVLRQRPAAVAFGLWCSGLVLIALFTKHDWSVGPSASGYVHWAGTLLAFLSLPVAMILLGRRWLNDRRWHGHALLSLALGVLSLLWFLPIVWAVGVHLTVGTPWWEAVPLGLVERLLAGTELLALGVAGWWAWSAGAQDTRTRTQDTRTRTQDTHAS